MEEVDNYIAKLDPAQSAIITELRSLVVANFPQLKEEFKWNQPVYTLNGKDVAYIVATKGGANFGLTKGAQLNDPKGLLEGTGKDMRHIKVASLDSIDLEYVEQLVDQAIEVAEK